MKGTVIMEFKTYAIALVVVAVSGGILAGPSVFAAESANANTDFGNLRQVQTLADANDGKFAASLEVLTNGELGQAVEMRKGSESFYAVNEAGDHFLFASKIPSGEVLVGSDESNAVTCEAYTVECVSQVTTDAELLAAVPVWVTF
jgi:hypothetical protein